MGAAVRVLGRAPGGRCLGGHLSAVDHLVGQRSPYAGSRFRVHLLGREARSRRGLHCVVRLGDCSFVLPVVVQDFGAFQAFARVAPVCQGGIALHRTLTPCASTSVCRGSPDPPMMVHSASVCGITVGTASRPTDRLAPSSWISFFMLETSFRTITRTSMSLSSFQSPRARDPKQDGTRDRVCVPGLQRVAEVLQPLALVRLPPSPQLDDFSPASFRSSVALAHRSSIPVRPGCPPSR